MKNFPIWVFNPATGKDIDVAPLLTVLNQFDAPSNTPINTGAREAIKRTIRVLNVTVHDPHVNNPILLANLYKDLHLLEDMFDQLSEKAA